MNYKLAKISQEHLLKHWDKLSTDQQNYLLADIATLDVDTFNHQKALLSTPPTHISTISPFDHCAHKGDPQNEKVGIQLLQEGAVGTLLIAGGQGTRLKLNGPKGMFPVTVIRKKTLFQLFAEKTVAASKQAGKLLPLAIMTSPIN